MKTCETCRREWPEEYEHSGAFARFPYEPHPDDADIDALIEEQSRLTGFARTVFHSIFCVWKEGGNRISLEEIDDLTLLGRMLCWEIARYEQRILRAVPPQADQPNIATKPPNPARGKRT